MNMRLAVLVGRNGVLSIKQWMYKWATRVRWPCTRNRAHHMPTTAHIQIKAINVWIWPSNFTVKFDACGMVAAETDSFYHISNVHKIGVATEYYDENIRIYLCNFIFNASRTFCPPYDAVCARAHVRCTILWFIYSTASWHDMHFQIRIPSSWFTVKLPVWKPRLTHLPCNHKIIFTCPCSLVGTTLRSAFYFMHGRQCLQTFETCAILAFVSELYLTANGVMNVRGLRLRYRLHPPEPSSFRRRWKKTRSRQR